MVQPVHIRGQDMRAKLGMIVLAAMIAGAALFAPTPGLAQQGPEYVNHELRFMLNFPIAPIEGNASYVSLDGTTHSARVFSAEDESGRYRMSVVRFPTELTDVPAELDHAANLVRPRGQILHDLLANYDGVPGHELNLTGPEGRQIYASILYNDHLLYFVEAEVGADSAPPIRFQTSVVILDNEGNPVCLSEGGLACLTIAN